MFCQNPFFRSFVKQRLSKKLIQIFLICLSDFSPLQSFLKTMAFHLSSYYRLNRTHYNVINLLINLTKTNFQQPLLKECFLQWSLLQIYYFLFLSFWSILETKIFEVSLVLEKLWPIYFEFKYIFKKWIV